jgi:arginine deiminase
VASSARICRLLRVRSLRWQTLNLDDFVLAPLPNTLFHRDNSACVYGGVTINPMAKATPGSDMERR